MTVYECQQYLPPFGVVPKLQLSKVIFSGEINSETIFVLFENLMYLMINHVAEDIQSLTQSEITFIDRIKGSDILDISISNGMLLTMTET